MPKIECTMIEAPERAVEADLAQDDDDRVEHHLIGDEGAEDQDGEEDVGALEAPVGQRVAVHRGDGDREDHRGHGDADRVPEAAAESPSQLSPVQASAQALTQGSKVISTGGEKMLPRRISGMPFSEVTTIT